MSDPLDLDGLALKAARHLTRGEEAEAHSCYRDLCFQDPDQPEWLQALADLSIRSGAIEEAVGALGRLALVRRRQGRLKEAFEACDRALAQRPPGAWQSTLERLRMSLQGTGTFPAVSPEPAVPPAAAPEASVARPPEAAVGPSAPPPASPGRSLEILSQTPLLAGLPPTALGGLLATLATASFSTGDLLMKEGDPGAAMYFITAGEVQVCRHRRRFGHFGGNSGDLGIALATLGPGSLAGEMALFSTEPRSATVIAIAPTSALVMTRAQARALVERFPELLQRARMAMCERLVSSVLRTSPLFGTLSAEDRQGLIRAFELRFIEAGQDATTEGEMVDALNVVLTGELEVTQVGRSSPIPPLWLGDVFGELSMLGQIPATATVTATRSCWTLALPRTRFLEVLQGRPGLAVFLERLGASRRAADLPLDRYGGLEQCWF